MVRQTDGAHGKPWSDCFVSGYGPEVIPGRRPFRIGHACDGFLPRAR